MSKPKLISLLFLITFCLFLYGQETVSFSKLNRLNGLSNNTINDIKQDASGYLWIATNKGLNRFDGFEFRTYQSSTSAILQSDYVYCLEIDSKGRLWFGTSDGGLYYLNLIEDKIYSVAKGLMAINVIVEREDGSFWIGAKSGLYLMKQKSLEQYDFRQYSELNTQAIRRKGAMLWLGTSTGVYFFDTANKKFVPIAQEKIGEELVLDIELNEEELWIATRSQGVFIYQIKSKQFKSFKERIPYSSFKDFKYARKILKGNNNKMYIGTDGAGLLVYDNHTLQTKQFTNTTNPNSISSNTIFSIYEDDGGSIWLGHIRKGISIIDNNKVEVDVFFREHLSKEYSDILSIYEEENGDILCGTDGKGVFKIVKKSNQTTDLSRLLDIENTYVQSIFRDSKKRLWIGTFSKGVFIQKPNSKPQQLKSKANDIRGFCEDEDGNIWIATNGQGLFKYLLDGTISEYVNQPNNPNSLSNNNILSLSFLKGKIYLATDGGGLNILNTETEKIQRLLQTESPNSILGDNLICLFVQNEDNTWVGSTTGITNIIQKDGQKRFTRYAFGDMSLRRFILGILVDDKNQVWVSTDEGLYRLDQSNGKFSKVNLGSSFNSTEFHYNSCHKFSDGKLFFGSTNGLFSFYPENLSQVGSVNRVKITGFKVFGKEEDSDYDFNTNYLMQIDDGVPLVIDASTSLIQIDFANISLPSSKGYQYAVQLKNYENEWQYLGEERTVSYDNLTSGDYTFKVKCIDVFSTKENLVTQFEIDILTPIWKSWWAITIYIFSLGSLMYLAFRYLQQWSAMKKNLKEEKLTREREEAIRKMQVTFFTNISHDIRTPLTLILGNIKRLTQKQVKDKKQPQELNIIENNINRLLSLSNELLDFRKIETGNFKVNLIKGDISILLKESFYAFYDHAIERNIQYQLEGAHKEIFVLFDYDQLEKVFFNLLSNAFKFTSNNGSIELTVNNPKDDDLQISISNTGQTLSSQQQESIFNRFYQQQSQGVEDEAIGPGVGIGLSIVKDIVDLHHGAIKVESENGKTSFILFLKKENDTLSSQNKKDTFTSNDNIEKYIAQQKIPIQPLNRLEENEFKDACLLIVEDSYELRKFLVDSLKKSYQVIEAENGKQAFELALKETPDLIISDVMMPEMDGISFCFKIKTNIKTSHIPVILLTARKSRYFKLKGLETGADDYINKPFYDDELKIRIRNLLKIRKDLSNRFKLEAITKPEGVKLNSLDQQFVQDFCNIIEANIDNSALKAKDISKELNMSHSLVYKKLKALTGYTLVEFIRDYRLQKAEMLLVQDQLTIAEICYRVGFNDRRYFSTCFKNKYQLSPREYLDSKKHPD
ncbi:MAG: two-component regulator propeller domain-containing protein [Saprospiraceae bacterium]